MEAGDGRQSLPQPPTASTGLEWGLVGAGIKGDSCDCLLSSRFRPSLIQVSWKVVKSYWDIRFRVLSLFHLR